MEDSDQKRLFTCPDGETWPFPFSSCGFYLIQLQTFPSAAAQITFGLSHQFFFFPICPGGTFQDLLFFFNRPRALNIQQWAAAHSPIKPFHQAVSFSLFTPDSQRVAEHHRVFHVATAERQSQTSVGFLWFPSLISRVYFSLSTAEFSSFGRFSGSASENFISDACSFFFLWKLFWSDLCRTHAESLGVRGTYLVQRMWDLLLGVIVMERSQIGEHKRLLLLSNWTLSTLMNAQPQNSLWSFFFFFLILPHFALSRSSAPISIKHFSPPATRPANGCHHLRRSSVLLFVFRVTRGWFKSSTLHVRLGLQPNSAEHTDRLFLMLL